MNNTNVVFKDSYGMMGFDMAANEFGRVTAVRDYDRKNVDKLVKAVMIDLKNFNVSYKSFEKYYSFVKSPQFFLMYGPELAQEFTKALMNAEVTCESTLEEQSLAIYMTKLEQFANELVVGIR